MTRALTDNLKANLIKTTGDEPINLIEVSSRTVFTTPIRVTDCIHEVVSNGNTFVPFPFSLTIQNDKSNEAPTANLRFDNISRELTRWLEQLQGAPKATLRLMKVQEIDPDILEIDILYDLKNIVVTRKGINGRLGFDETINKIGNPTLYRQINSPGLF